VQSVFPPVTTAIISTHVPPPRLLQPSVFIPLHFLIFNSTSFSPSCHRDNRAPPFPLLNWVTGRSPTEQHAVGDYLGRTYLPAIPLLLITNSRHVLCLSLARTLWIPLFLLCNVAPTSTSSPPLLNSDTVYFFILLGFGVTNGYVVPLSLTPTQRDLGSLPNQQHGSGKEWQGSEPS
jgi:equilibrative nucleoside transporter 1/2/3